MTLLQCRELGYSVGTRAVLTDITLSVEREERVGLVGTNGSGKSTLLGLLGGTLVPDRGERLQRKGLKLELVSQFLPAELRERRAFELVLERAEAEHEARALLTRLGFDETAWSLRAEQLSGGWVNRLMLARAAASEPDLILLDEPTNHLDVESVVYVERFLTEQLRCAFILVSHDRELLDSLTDRTLFLREGSIHGFALAYSQARHALLTQENDALTLRNAQERKLDAVRASMKRLAHWGQVYDSEKFARRARSMGKRIERMEAEQQPPPWRDRRQLGLAANAPRAERLLDIEALTVTTPLGKPLFSIDQLHVRKGDRIALLGENGSGKTCLLRKLKQVFACEPGSERAVRYNPQVRLGYYDQELADLDPSHTLVQTLLAACDASPDRLRGALSKAGFDAASHGRSVATLSGGEKSRLQFLVLELLQPNLVLLDEPTNHMDLEGCEALEESLLSGETTVLFVSHDRRFVSNVATRWFSIAAGKLVEVADFEQYVAELGPARATLRRAPATSGGAGEHLVSVLESSASPDAILERILELEQKLQADQQRKLKHQKPALQAAWQAELTQLYALLA